MNHCSVISCLNKRKDKRFKFFTFPVDLDICTQWVDFCHCSELTERLTATGPYGLSKFVICSEHFDPPVVADVIQKIRRQLPADAVPVRIGKTHMTQEMLLEKGFDVQAMSLEHSHQPAKSGLLQIDEVLVEMLNPEEMENETAREGSSFEFVRMKTEDQLYEFEEGFKQEFVDADDGFQAPEVQPSPSGLNHENPANEEGKTNCSYCSKFKPRYIYEVKKNRRLEERINQNKTRIADRTTKIQKLHDRITLRKMKRIELRKKYVELKKRLKKGLPPEIVETKTSESEEGDDGSFDETAAWW